MAEIHKTREWKSHMWLWRLVIDPFGIGYLVGLLAAAGFTIFWVFRPAIGFQEFVHGLGQSKIVDAPWYIWEHGGALQGVIVALLLALGCWIVSALAFAYHMWVNRDYRG